MRKVKLITDSTADLDLSCLVEMEIEMVPLYVCFKDEAYHDRLAISTDVMYQRIESEGIMPTTQAASPGDFIKAFEPYIEAGYDIVYTGIGSSLSATFQSARVASLEFPKDRIYLVDSKNLSSGIALLVLKANQLKNQGLDAKTIHDRLTAMVPLVRSQFAIQTLDYLHKGGRASGTQKLMGSMLGIKPIIQVREGKLEVYKKAMGKMSRALDIMLKDLIDHASAVDLDHIMITHSQADRYVPYLKEKITAELTPKAIIESKAGCVISAHCGPGTIGILYSLKEG